MGGETRAGVTVLVDIVELLWKVPAANCEFFANEVWRNCDARRSR